MDEKLISGSFVIWTIMEFSISSPGVFKYMEIRHDKQLVETKKKKKHGDTQKKQSSSVDKNHFTEKQLSHILLMFRADSEFIIQPFLC